MNDTNIVDWLQHHATALRLHDEDAFGNTTYVLEWIDADAMPHTTTGCDLRDCVRGAVVESVCMTKFYPAAIY